MAYSHLCAVKEHQIKSRIDLSAETIFLDVCVLFFINLIAVYATSQLVQRVQKELF